VFGKYGYGGLDVIKIRIERGSAVQEQEVLTSKLSRPVSVPELMVWDYTEPAIILGCSQRRNQTDWQDMRSKRKSALTVVCRRSGGGAVLAGPWMMSATLILPAAHALRQLSLPAGFELFGRAWSKALAKVGIDNTLARSDRFAAFNQRAKAAALDWICFAGLSHGELLDADGRKLVGMAQIRQRRCSALVSGLFLQAPPWGVLLSANPQAGSQNALLKSNRVLQQLVGSVEGWGSGLESELLIKFLLESLNREIDLLCNAVVNPGYALKPNAIC
jgi:lipoate---protein ligase